SLPPIPTLISPADDPLTDVLATVRPSDPTALRSYNYYDGEGRLIGAVNEQGFLSATVFDEVNNKRQSIRYITPVSVTSGAPLQDLETAGGATETTTFQYTALGQLSSLTTPDGSVTTYQYDGAGRLIRQVMDAGLDDARASDTRYDAFGD